MYKRTDFGAGRQSLITNHHVALLVLLCGSMSGYCAQPPVYGGFFGTHYLQVGSMLMPHPSGSAAWECWVRNVPSGEVTETRVWTPLGEDLTCYPGPQGAYIVMALPSTMYRDMMLPPGTYQIEEVLANEESRTSSLTLTTGAAPGAPTVQNATEWGQWPAGKALPVAWQSGAGTVPSDTFVVSLEGLSEHPRYFETPMPGQSGALGGTTASCTIPAQCFTTNGTYYVRVSCYRAKGSGSSLTGQYSATLLMLVVTGQGQSDVAHYHFVNGRVFTQDGTNGPTLFVTNAYRAEILLRGVSAGSVKNAKVQAPGKPELKLVPDLDQLAWGWTNAYESEAALISAWPSGTYHWTVDGTMGGLQESDLPVTTGGWPNPLRVLNLGMLKTNTFEDDVVLSWSPTGSVANTDRIELAVFNRAGDLVLQVQDREFGRPIPGTDTSLIIESGTLSSGVEYIGCLRYLHVDAHTTNTLGGAEAIAGRFAETRFVWANARPCQRHRWRC